MASCRPAKACPVCFVLQVTEEEAERIKQESRQKRSVKEECTAQPPSPEGEEEPSAQKKVEEEELSKVSWQFVLAACPEERKPYHSALTWCVPFPRHTAVSTWLFPSLIPRPSPALFLAAYVTTECVRLKIEQETAWERGYRGCSHIPLLYQHGCALFHIVLL